MNIPLQLIPVISLEHYAIEDILDGCSEAVKLPVAQQADRVEAAEGNMESYFQEVNCKTYKFTTIHKAT